MIIRAATPGDLDAWLAMRVALWPNESPDALGDECRAYFAGPTQNVFVLLCCDAFGLPTGMVEPSERSCAEGCDAGPVPYIEAWFVHADRRGRGYGRALVKAAETWARGRGFKEIASDTQLSNTGGLRAHLALGFEEVERAVHFRKALA